MYQLLLVLLMLVYYVAATFDLPWTYPNYTDHECIRKCTGDIKRCYYIFTAEDWFSNSLNCLNCVMGVESDCNNPECIPADGREKHIMTFNRMFPGPAIQVCQGDEIMVDVVNNMDDLTTTIHWHGMHQIETPWMDGVPMITQCPIQPHNTFRYHFKAYGAGTHFYHSHSASQRVDGLFGPIIVRQTKSANKHYHEYDYDLPEHVITVNDNYNLTSRYHYFHNKVFKKFNFFMIVGVFINGRGTNDSNMIPPKKFLVTKGKKYRFRAIHAGGEPCPLELAIEGHRITVIASDGRDLKPFTVDKLVLTNGERYDFIIKANKSIGIYAIRLKGSILCHPYEAFALLQYKNSKPKPIIYNKIKFDKPNDTTANCVNLPLNDKCYNYINMTSIEPMPSRAKKIPDLKFYIGFDIYPYAEKSLLGVNDKATTRPFINNISTPLPTRPLLLNNFDKTQPFCDPDNMNRRKYCEGQFCECIYLLKIPLDSLVELIYVNEFRAVDLEDIIHPFHLHGYEHWTIGEGKIDRGVSTEIIKELDNNGELIRNFANPPVKDTVQIATGGYTIIRFLADNPGYWLLHCHIDFHTSDGMMMVILVDDFKRTRIHAPNYMPKCYNYLENNTFGNRINSDWDIEEEV